MLLIKKKTEKMNRNRKCDNEMCGENYKGRLMNERKGVASNIPTNVRQPV